MNGSYGGDAGRDERLAASSTYLSPYLAQACLHTLLTQCTEDLILRAALCLRWMCSLHRLYPACLSVPLPNRLTACSSLACMQASSPP